MFKNETAHEVIEKFEEYNLKIIQNNKYFKFGIDSIVLAKFAALDSSNHIILDLCSGSGVVGLLYSRLIDKKLQSNSSYRSIKKMYFIEKQAYFADLNQRNIDLNDLQGYEVLNFDIKDDQILDIIAPNSIDIILSNPPYYISTSSIPSESKEMLEAKFGDEDFLDKFFYLANKLLKDKGVLFMINKPERLVDLFVTSRKHNIEPKILRNVLSSSKKKSSLILIKFVKNANSFLKIEDPYIINKD